MAEGYILGEAAAEGLRELLARRGGQGSALPAPAARRVPRHVRVTGPASGGWHPCVPTDYVAEDGTWEDGEAGVVSCPNGTLAAGATYEAVPCAEAPAYPGVGAWTTAGGKAGVTVQEQDGSPSLDGIGVVQFHQTDGFVVSQPATGTALVRMQAASATQAGIVTTGTQTLAGDKTFTGGVAIAGPGTFSLTAPERRPPFAFSIANGANNNLDVSGAGRALMRLTGPTAPWSITGIGTPTPVDGDWYWFLNATGHTGTIKNQDPGSTASFRIVAPGGSDYSVPDGGSFGVLYDGASSRFRLASGPLSSTGSGTQYYLARWASASTLDATSGVKAQTAGLLEAECALTVRDYLSVLDSYTPGTLPTSAWNQYSDTSLVWHLAHSATDFVTVTTAGLMTLAGTGAVMSLPGASAFFRCRGLDGVTVTEAGITYTGGIRTGGTLAIDTSSIASGTLAVARGGTGRGTATAYAVLCGGTTSTGAHQSVAALGNSGEPLLSGGAGALPAFGQADTAGLKDKAVTYAKIQDVAANSVLARAAGTSGVVSAVALSTQQLMGRGTGNATNILLGSGFSIDGSDTLQQSIVPPGCILPYGASSAPSGYLLCDGSAVSRTTYAALFAVVGTTFGAGDGSTTFNVPDTRGRSPMGSGTGSGLTARTLGSTYGAETVALSTSELASHTHGPGGSASNFWGTGTGTSGLGAGALNFAIPTATASAGSGSAHANVHPVLAVQFIIKT